MATETDIDNTNVSTHASPNVINKQAVKIMDMDKVSAAMGTYMLQGWAMLNDGCPDCNTPLMCNREATSQICVNCQLNPPVDSVEANQTQASPQSDGQILSQTASSISPSSPSPLPAVHTLSTPAPTTALPAPPSGPRSTSPQNHRVSALEPMAEARRPLRPVGNRNIGGSGPAPPSTPPPRSSTSLPAPPTTPPPSGVIKSALGSLSSKPNIPRPPGQPPSLPLSPPPASTHFTQPVPRDMRRSPQSSIILSGNILPPSTPLPALPGPSSTPPSFPSPPAQTSSSASTPETEMNSTAATAERQESANELSTDGEESIVKAEAIGPITNTSDVESSKVAAEFVQEYKPEISELHQNSTEGPTQGENQDQKQEHQQSSTSGDGGEDDKGAESDDDFEDAAEEVYKPTEEEIKERNLRREQSERASQLIGQKMLQGWAMLQDPCPNPSCHGVLLLRSREKKEYCVICETFFQREQDLEQGKYTIVSSSTNSTATPAATTTASGAATANSTSTLPKPAPPSNAASQPAALAAFPSPPQVPSPVAPPQHQSVTGIASPPNKAVSSPIPAPFQGRTQRELLGRISNPINLPPAGLPSFAAPTQQMLGKHLNEDVEKPPTEDEETRKQQIIRRGSEFSNRSLPPVPGSPAPPSTPAGARPMSTYSNPSDNASESERQEPKYHRHRHTHAQGSSHNGQQGETSAPTAPPPPLSPEVQALVAATQKTIATILVKLETYRLALELSESPKECQILTSQIKGLMECLKACRETL